MSAFNSLVVPKEKQHLPSRKALARVDISKVKKPAGYRRWSPERMRNWRYRTAKRVRDALILREYLAADDKKEVIKTLTEKWDFEKKGKVDSIIKKQNEFGVRIASMAVDIEAYRQIRIGQIAESSSEYLDYLNHTLDHLFTLDQTGNEFISVEEIEQTGDIETLKEKRIPIRDAIVRVYKMINATYSEEAKTIAEHVGRPLDKQILGDVNIIQIQADKDFVEHFARLGTLDKSKEIHAEGNKQ